MRTGRTQKRNEEDVLTVLYTGVYGQIVAMSIPVGGDIGEEEKHPTTDQVL